MRDVWILLVMSLITSLITMIQCTILFAKRDKDDIISTIAACAASLTVVFLVAIAFIFPR